MRVEEMSPTDQSQDILEGLSLGYSYFYFVFIFYTMQVFTEASVPLLRVMTHCLE